MTEAEWLAATDPIPMLKFLSDNASNRKLRLLDCACGWYLEQYSPDTSVIDALRRAELYSDGKIAESTLRKWYKKVDALCVAVYTTKPCDPKEWMASHVVSCACSPIRSIENSSPPHFLGGYRYRTLGKAWLELDYQENGFGPQAAFFPPEWLREAKRTAVHTLLDLFGNPFRPLTLNPAWLTSTVLALATGIYEERAFDRMPILADALQDAGCENAEILNHCRELGEHVKGCWVVDLLLDKK
jgi:hypothetical protein